MKKRLFGKGPGSFKGLNIKGLKINDEYKRNTAFVFQGTQQFFIYLLN